MIRMLLLWVLYSGPYFRKLPIGNSIPLESVRAYAKVCPRPLEHVGIRRAEEIRRKDEEPRFSD